jgi:hypothetical protein
MPDILNVLQSLQQEQQALQDQMRFREALECADLSAEARRTIRQRFAGQPYDEAAVSAAIAEAQQHTPLIDRSAWSTGEVHLPGQSRDGARLVHLGESAEDKLLLGLDGFWAGEDLKRSDGTAVPRFTSLEQAYEVMMRKKWHPMTALREATALDLRTGHHYDSAGRDQQRMVEALQTASWGQVLGDSLTRRMLAEYRRPDLQVWRPMTSEISNVRDFRLQRRMRVGGYGVLPTVPEGISYSPLTSPEDEESTYTIAKKGGLETITLEALANDSDIGALRRTPQRMGRAAARTLYRQFFDMFRLNSALTVTGDSTALFTVAHANTSAGLVLNVAGLNQAILGLSQQTEFGVSTEVLGLRPKFLLHASNLRPTVHQLLNTSNVPQTADYGANQFLQFGINPIEIFYWPNDLWVLCADPVDSPTCEVGFFRGIQEPELYEASSETVEGSMFFADKAAYKVRFIFGTMISDHRSFYSNF